jgi:DNA repair protein RecN (Recombination protein N)
MPYGSIANIASGGEVSRFMLAIKIVLNNQKLNSVIIFDEIDAGVGGKTAEIMGKKIKQLSKSRQIILITHQPQIAVFSDSHFKIEKHSVGNEDRVVTTVKNLSKDEKTAELARMLFGNKVDEQSMAVVKSMVISSSTSNS